MFGKNKKRKQVMRKIKEELSKTDNWIRKSEGFYYCLSNPGLVIQCHKPFSDSAFSVFAIIEPTFVKIPLWHQLEIWSLLKKIDNREENKIEAWDFVEQALRGEFKTKLKYRKKSISEITIWLKEQNIIDCYIETNTNFIWFKHLEDAMAFKLRWNFENETRNR